MGLEGFTLVDFAIRAVLSEVGLDLGDRRVEASFRPCDLDGEEGLVVTGGEGQTNAKHQCQDLCKIIKTG